MSDPKISIHFGECNATAESALAGFRRSGMMARIWAKDHTVWKPAPTEISNRLGWLDSPRVMADRLREIGELTENVRRDGYAKALLLGMGGSSLAPEVFRKTFGAAKGFLDLDILDSTDPGAVMARAEQFPPAETLFIVATKSGGTVETFSFLKYFYNRTMDRLGREAAGQHFIAITDPGSGLADTAQKLGFRHIFYNDPDIGGRYSALSCFGLVPASLLGMDVQRFLRRAAAVAAAEQAAPPADGWSAGALGAVLGALAGAGRNKWTFFFSPEIESFGDWLEQLIAESTGKEGKGIVPVVGEAMGPPHVYGADRLFVSLRLAGDTWQSEGLTLLEQAGHPVIHVELQDIYDLGGQCFFWELVTAVAGACLAINPFDQPNVEAAKVFARQMVAQYLEQGCLPAETPDFSDQEASVYGPVRGGGLREMIARFLESGRAGDYVAVQAYVTPTPATDEALEKIRLAVRERYRLATTVGYGPRFLHSTGQLHKGDSGQGVFLQITADDVHDAPIPDEAGEPSSRLTFGTLKAAQALGDRRALLEAGRRVLRLHLKGDGISRLASLIL